MAGEMDYTLADDAIPVFHQYITERMKKPYFSNARTVRNAMDLARKRMALRLFEQAMSGHNNGMLLADELSVIRGVDFQGLLEDVLAAGDDAILA